MNVEEEIKALRLDIEELRTAIVDLALSQAEQNNELAYRTRVSPLARALVHSTATEALMAGRGDTSSVHAELARKMLVIAERVGRLDPLS